MTQKNTATKQTEEVTSVDQIFPSKKGKAKPIMSMAELAKYVQDKGLKTKSDTFRSLFADGHSIASIAVTCEVKYQFVRNVIKGNK